MTIHDPKPAGQAEGKGQVFAESCSEGKSTGESQGWKLSYESSGQLDIEFRMLGERMC